MSTGPRYSQGAVPAAETVARVTKIIGRMLVLNIVWFLCFAAGALWTVFTFAHNSSGSLSCTGLSSSCGHDSYVLPVALLLVGFLGMPITAVVATRLAIKHVGLGAMAFMRARRTNTAGAPWPGGAVGLPGAMPGGPPGFVGGMPPGAPGTPTGPPL